VENIIGYDALFIVFSALYQNLPSNIVMRAPGIGASGASGTA